MPDQTEWIIVGDFNLIRRPEDRNREGGDTNEMFLFNEAIIWMPDWHVPVHVSGSAHGHDKTAC